MQPPSIRVSPAGPYTADAADAAELQQTFFFIFGAVPPELLLTRNIIEFIDCKNKLLALSAELQ
jgi:hypothetical protein